MGIFDIIFGLLLVYLGNCQYLRPESPTNVLAIDPAARLNSAEYYSRDYYTILKKHEIAWLLRENLIDLFGSILNVDLALLPTETVLALSKIYHALRLRELSTLDALAVMPDVASCPHQQQLLSLLLKLQFNAPVHLKSYLTVLIDALGGNSLDIDGILRYLPPGTVEPNIFNGINRLSLIDIKIDTVWPISVQNSINRSVEALLDNFFAATLSAISVGHIKATNKLLTYLIMSLPLDSYDAELNEAFHYVFDATDKMEDLTGKIREHGVYGDPYVMAQRFLRLLADNENEHVAECAKIILNRLKPPTGRSSQTKPQGDVVQFKDTKLAVDFVKLFDVITASEFPRDVFYAKNKILRDVVQSGRYNIDGVLKDGSLYYAQNEVDKLVIVLDRFMRRLSLPDDDLDSIRLVRSHLLLLRRYRNSYNNADESAVSGFSDVRLYMETFYNQEPVTKVSKYIKEQLSWLTVCWSSELKFLPQMRIARQTAGKMLQMIRYKKLIPDKKFDLVVQQFLASNFTDVDWSFIAAGSRSPYTGESVRPYVKPKFEMNLKVNLSSLRFKVHPPKGLKQIEVTMSESRLGIDMSEVCVDRIRFKTTNPDFRKSLQQLLDELPDINNPQMFWPVKTFLLLNYKYVFDSEFEVCRFPNHRQLLIGLFSKLLGLEIVQKDQDLQSACSAYLSALNSGANKVDLPSILNFLQEPAMKFVLPVDVNTLPQDLETLRPLIRKAYAIALKKKFDSIDYERFQKLENMFKEYNKHYDISDFNWSKFEDSDKRHLEILKNTLKPENLLMLLGPDFDKSLSKNPKQLLISIIKNILKYNAGSLMKPTEEALQYFLDTLGEAKSIINLENIPEIDQTDKLLPELAEILRWDHLHPLLRIDFKYPDKSTPFEQLVYIIKHVLENNPKKIGSRWMFVLKHFQLVFSKAEPLPVINVFAIPGLHGTPQQITILNKVLRITNLIKFLPPSFQYQDSSSPQTQLKNIIESLLLFSKTKLKPSTVDVLIHFNEQLSNLINHEIIDVFKIKEISPQDQMFTTLREMLRKEIIFTILPPDFKFAASLPLKQQLLKILQSVVNNGEVVSIKWVETANHFIEILVEEVDINNSVIQLDEIKEICTGDPMLPSLRDILKPKMLWELVDINYKANPKGSPKAQLKNIIDNILKYSVERLSKLQFDVLNHFQDILDYADECRNLPPLVNVTYVPQIDPNDQYCVVLYDILRIDIITKLVGHDFQFSIYHEQHLLLRSIIEYILNKSMYKLKPRWIAVLQYFLSQLKSYVNFVINLPELKGQPDLDVVVQLIERPDIVACIDDVKVTYISTKQRVAHILKVVKKEANFLDSKFSEALDKLLAAVNSSDAGVIDTDKIEGIYVTNPNYPALYFFLQNPNLVNKLAPNFHLYKHRPEKDRLLFLFRDVLSTNSSMLTPNLRKTIIYFYRLLTESTDKLAANVFKPKEIEDILFQIPSIQSDKFLVALKLILLNPNLIQVYKPGSLSDLNEPNKILLYIINSISINYPAMEMIKEIKEILDHFRVILVQPSLKPPRETYQPVTMPEVSVVNPADFLIEFQHYVGPIAQNTEKKLLNAILYKPNIFDLLELQWSQMFRNTPMENVHYILNAIKNHWNEVKVFVPNSSLDALIILISKLGNDQPDTQGVGGREPKTEPNLPTEVISEIENVINVFLDVPNKELITVVLRLKNIETLLNLSTKEMLFYRPDQKLYYFIRKLNENINTISGFFPNQPLENIVHTIISKFNPGNEFLKPKPVEGGSVSYYMPDIKQVMEVVYNIVRAPERQLIAQLFQRVDLVKLLQIDIFIANSNTPEQNMIYVLYKAKELGQKINSYFPGTDMAAAVLQVLTYGRLTTRTPYENTTPMILTISLIKEKIIESINYLRSKYHFPNQENSISVLKQPGLGAILGLNQTILEYNSPRENVLYIFQKIAENIESVSVLFPDKDVTKIAEILVRDMNSNGEHTIVQPILERILETIRKYHQKSPNLQTILFLANMSLIEQTINFDPTTMMNKSPLENMITIFQKVKENVGKLSTLLSKEEIDQAVTVVLKENKLPSSLIFSAIRNQINNIYITKPEKELLMEITKISNIESTINVNIAMMKYNSPLENMIYFFQNVKRDIKAISSFLPGKNVKEVITEVLKGDRIPVAQLLMPVKQQIESFYKNAPNKELLLHIISVAEKIEAINFNVQLMNRLSPIEKMIYVFGKVKENLLQVVSVLPGKDVENAVTTILKPNAHFMEVSVVQIIRQIEYYYGNHPQKEVLIQITKFPDAENELHLNLPLMQYHSPQVNMIYYFQRVKDEIDKMAIFFPGKNIETLVNIVLKEEGKQTFSKLMIPVRQKIESILTKHPHKELLIKITKSPAIEHVISVNIPVMRYNSPLQNMIYFFQRVKDDINKVMELFPGKNIQNALTIVLQKDGILPAVILISISKQIEVFHNNSIYFVTLVELTTMPDIEYILNLDMPLMSYYTPLEKMIYFFERAKDNLEELSFMYPGKNFKQAIDIVLKVEEKPWTTIVSAIRNKIESLHISQEHKNILIQITKIPGIEKEINIHMPVTKYISTLENMIYFFKMVNENIRTVSTFLPNQDVKQAITVILREKKTLSLTLFQPVTQQIETIYKNHPKKELMVKILKFPNILDKVNVNEVLVKYNPPLLNMIHFFRKVKENVEQVSLLLPNEDINGVVVTILQEDGKPTSVLLVSITKQIITFYADSPHKELMIELINIPRIERILQLDLAVMKYNSPFENMIYFFQKVKENIDSIEFQLLPTEDIKTVIRLVLKEENLRPVQLAKAIKREIEILYPKHPAIGLIKKIVSITGIENEIHVNLVMTRYLPPLEKVIHFFECVKENIGAVSAFVPESDVQRVIEVVLKEKDNVTVSFTAPILRQIESYYGYHPDKETFIQIVNSVDPVESIGLNPTVMKYHSHLENMVYFFQKVKENIEIVSKLLPGKNVNAAVITILKENLYETETILQPILRQIERFFTNADKNLLVKILKISNIIKLINLPLTVMKYKSPLENLLYFFHHVRENAEEITAFVPVLETDKIVSIVQRVKDPTRLPNEDVIVKQITKYFHRHPEMEAMIQIVKTPKIQGIIKLDFPLMTYYTALEKMIYFFERVKDNVELVSIVVPDVNVDGAIAAIFKDDGTKPAEMLVPVAQEVQTLFKGHSTEKLLVQITKIPDIENIIGANLHVMKFHSPLENMIYFYQKVEDSLEIVSQYLPDSDIGKALDFVLKKDNLPVSTLFAPIVQQITKFFKHTPTKETLISITKVKDIDRLLQINKSIMKYNPPLQNMIYFLEAVKENMHTLTGIFPEEQIRAAILRAMMGVNSSELSAKLLLEIQRRWKYDPEYVLLITILKIPNIETMIYLNLLYMKYNPPLENVIYFFEKVNDNIKEVSTILPGQDIPKVIAFILKYDKVMEQLIMPIIKQITTLKITMPVKQLLLQIARTPDIQKILYLNIPAMHFRRPLENMIYFYQMARDNIDKLSALFPNQDLKTGISIILRDNVTATSLKVSIAEKMEQLFFSLPAKITLIEMTKIPNIEDLIYVTLPVMSYQSPIENTIYFLERVQENSLTVSRLLPGTDVNAVLQVVLDNSIEQTSFVFSKVLQQIETYYYDHPSKKLMMQILKIPSIEKEIHVSVPLTKFLNPLENMIYIFQQIKADVGKVSKYFPGPEVEQVVSIVLKEDGKDVKQTILVPIVKAIESFYKQPEINSLTKIVYIPGIEDIIGINVAIMKYYTPVENMIYFFQKVEEQIRTVSRFVPGVNLKDLVTTILKKPPKPMISFIKPILEVIESTTIATPDKNVLIQILNIPDVKDIIYINVPVMHYNSPVQNLIHFFQKVKENMREISKLFPGIDVQKVVSFLLENAVNATSLRPEVLPEMTADILLPIFQQVEKFYYNKPEVLDFITIFKTKHIENKLPLSVKFMNESTPLENMVYLFQTMKHNIGKVAAFVPGNVEEILRVVLFESVKDAKNPVELIQGQIERYFNEQPNIELIMSITKLPNIQKTLNLNVPVMYYQSPLENLIYFFQRVKTNILQISKSLPGKDIGTVVASVLKEVQTHIKPTNVIASQITKYYPKKTENEWLIKILNIPNVVDIIHMNKVMMKYNPPLENMITFFQNVKDNIGAVSKYLPQDVVKQALAVVLKEDLKPNKPTYIIKQIVQKIEEIFYKSPEKKLLIEIVKMPNLERLFLNNVLMMYKSPLENMIYFFEKVKDSLPIVSKYLGGKDVSQTISRVLREKQTSITVESNKNPLLSSVYQLVGELFFTHPNKDLIQGILIHKYISQNIHINFPLMVYLSPIEKLVHFYQQLEDNIDAISQMVSNLDVTQAVAIVLRYDARDHQNTISKTSELLEPIIQQIYQRFKDDPMKVFMIQMIKMPAIEYKLKLNIPLMTYYSPLENLVYFFQKAKENIAELSVLLPGSDVNNVISFVLKEKEAEHKIEHFIPVINGQIEKYNAENPQEQQLLTRILNVPDIVYLIHLSIPLMVYQSPLENYVYFFMKVKEDAGNLGKHVSRRDVDNALTTVLGRGNPNITFHEPVEELFPIVGQIEKYVSNTVEKELLIEILQIPDIEQKIHLRLPLMMYQYPLENMIYVFMKVKDSLKTVSGYFPGKEIEITVTKLLTGNTGGPTKGELSIVCRPVIYQIFKFVSSIRDKYALIQVFNITGIEHLIHLAVPVMIYQSPLENMIYFFQKTLDQVVKVSEILKNSKLKSIILTIIKEKQVPMSYLFKQIENKIEYYFKRHAQIQTFIKILKLPDLIKLVHLNVNLMRIQSPLQNMIYIFKMVGDNVARVTTVIPIDELKQALNVVLKQDQPIEFSMSAIRGQIEIFFTNPDDKRLLLQITNIPNVEILINLNVALMKYSSPIENMVYFFQVIKDDVRKISLIIPGNEVDKVLQVVLSGSEQQSITLMQPIFKQIDLLFYKDRVVKGIFIQISNVPGIESQVKINFHIFKYLSPLESLIYFSQKVKENIEEISKFLPKPDLEKVLLLILKESEMEPIVFLKPVLQQIEVFSHYIPDKEIINQITSFTDIRNELILNNVLMKYFSPLENFVYFFQKIKENVDKVSALFPGKDIRNLVTTILRDDKNITITIYLPVQKQIEYLYENHNIKSVFIEMIQIPNIERIIGINIPVMKYTRPLENMIYFFQMVKNNIEDVSKFLPGRDLNKTLSIVLGTDGKPSKTFVFPIQQRIEAIYYKQPHKELMIEICRFPGIEDLVNINIPLMKYQSPLENMVHFFQKVKDNIDKVIAVFPGKDINKVVATILKEGNDSLVSQIVPIVRKIETIYTEHPQKEILVQASKIPQIEFLINLNLPLMKYYSPLENMIYLFQNIDYNRQQLSAIFPGNYLNESIAVILKINEEPMSTLLLSVRNEINLFFNKLPDNELLHQITKLRNVELTLNLNLAFMRYNSALENMIYFFQMVKDQSNKIVEFFPGKNVSKIAGVVIKDDGSLPGMLITAIVHQIEFWYETSPDKKLIIDVIRIPDMENLIHINIPLMKYKPPLENMLYFFKNVKDNIDTLSQIVPNLDLTKAITIVFRQDPKYTGITKVPGESVLPIIFQKHFTPHQQAMMVPVVKIPQIEKIVGLNLPLMEYFSPLEKMVYFFTAANENVAKVSKVMPNTDVRRAISIVLDKDKNKMVTILKEIELEIQTYYQGRPESKVLLEITRYPGVESLIFLNPHVMVYNSLVGNLVYFFQNVKYNIEKVSQIIVPGKNVQEAVALVLKEGGPPISTLLLPLIEHIKIFYVKEPDKDIFIHIVKSTHTLIEICPEFLLNIPQIRYQTDLQNLIYFFENVKFCGSKVSVFFPDGDVVKALTKFLVYAAKYIESLKTIVNPTIPTPRENSSYFIPEILEQIEFYFSQRADKKILIQIARLPNIEELIKLDSRYISKTSPIENLKYFLRKAAENVKAISRFFPGINLEQTIIIALDILDTNPTTPTSVILTTTESTHLIVPSIPDGELIVEAIYAFIPETEREWVVSMFRLKNIIGILGLDTVYMRTQTPIENLKYFLKKAEQNVEQLVNYFPGKNMTALIMRACKAITSPVIGGTSTTRPGTVLTTTTTTTTTTTPSPLNIALPSYLEEVIRSIPNNVSSSSIMIFATLLKTHNFVTSLKLPAGVLECFTPRQLLEAIVNIMLKDPDLKGDVVIQAAITDIARVIGIQSGTTPVTPVIPTLTVVNITAKFPGALTQHEIIVLEQFLKDPKLFLILNIEQDTNTFLYQYPTQMKQLEAIFSRAISNLYLPRELRAIIVKMLRLLITYAESQNTVQKIVLSLSSSVPRRDIEIVRNFLTRKNLLRDIGLTIDRSHYQHDNDFAYAILQTCITVQEVINNKPLYNSIITIMQGIKDVECQITPQRCKINDKFERVKQVLGLNETTLETFKEILEKCNVLGILLQDMHLANLKSILWNVFNTEVVERNVHYTIIIRSVLIRLGFDPRRLVRIDIKSLIALIPTTTKHYVTLVNFFNVFDISRLMGTTLYEPDVYKSPSRIFLVIIERLLSQVVNPGNAVLYEGLVDLAAKLKAKLNNGNYAIIQQLISYLPHSDARWVVQDFLTKHDVLAMLGNTFDITLYNDTKSQLVNLLAKLSAVDTVVDNTLLYQAIKMCLLMLQHEGNTPSPTEIANVGNFEKLMKLIVKGQHRQYYAILEHFLSQPNLRVKLGPSFHLQDYKSARQMLRVIIERSIRLKLYGNDAVLRECLRYFLQVVRTTQIDFAVTEKMFTVQVIKNTQTVDFNKVFYALDYNVANTPPQNLIAIQKVFKFFERDGGFSAAVHFRGFNMRQYAASNGIFVQALFKHLLSMSDSDVPPNIKSVLNMAYPYILLTGPGAVPVEIKDKTEISQINESSRQVESSLSQKDLVIQDVRSK